MHILIALILAPALLYFWLIGHWFARVLTFLVFAALLGGGGGALLLSAPDAPPAAGIFGAIIGAALAWFVSGIPIYVRRQQQTATLRRGFEMIHPDWTPEQITSRITRQLEHNQGGSR